MNTSAVAREKQRKAISLIASKDYTARDINFNADTERGR